MTSWWKWRDTVVNQVRFFPDRAKIAEELDAHYEDHVKDLERIGFEHELAEQRALQAMGDAVEVGRAMDLAHKPGLGWLWLISKWGAVFAVFAAMIMFLGQYNWIDYFKFYTNRVQREGDYETDGISIFSEGWEKENAVRIMIGKGTNTIERCGDEFSVPYAAVWKCHFPATDDNNYTPYDAYWIVTLIAADDRNPIDSRTGHFLEQLVLTNDDGSYYDTKYERIGTGENGEEIWGPADGRLVCGLWDSDPYRALYRTRVSYVETLPEEWSTLAYSYGEPWEIVIEWEEVQP